MEIRKATLANLEQVKTITYKTINGNYHEIESHSIVTENEDVLCYDVMEKRK